MSKNTIKIDVVLSPRVDEQKKEGSLPKDNIKADFVLNEGVIENKTICMPKSVEILESDSNVLKTSYKEFLK